MNKATKLILTVVVALTSSAFAKTPQGWVTGVEDSIALAEKEKKNVMMLFTGSDFCPPCILMEKKVFSKKEFVEKASKDFILVFIDFPEGDEALAKSNAKYETKYKAEGYPQVVVLDPAAKEIGRFWAEEYPGVDVFLKKLDEVKERSQLD